MPFARIGENMRASYHIISSLQCKRSTKSRIPALDKSGQKSYEVTLIYEANFENFSTYTVNFQPKNLKNSLDH